jgi:glycerate dehydrogenase
MTAAERPVIVVLDGHTLSPGDDGWQDLRQLGEVRVYDRTPVEAVVSRARDAAILVTNKTPLPAEVLAELGRLRFVAVLATGTDVVDVAAASRLAIPVSNVPEYGTEAVAQHTFALILELASRVGLHDAAVHAGEWSRAPDFCFWKVVPMELAGMTLGIVGFGRIGRRVAEIAGAFRMRVIAAARDTHRGAAADVERRPLDELFAEADVVSLHCPLTPATRALAGRERLARMKPTAWLVNTARGALVDEAALAEALTAGRLAGAAVDVVSAEPIRPDNPLLGAPNVVMTPHVAWATTAARRRLMAETVANVAAFLAGEPRNLVGLSVSVG